MIQTRTLRAFLVVAIEALSLVMLATAARTEPIQHEGLPTATPISQTLVDSANTSPEAVTESVPNQVLDNSTDANATPKLLHSPTEPPFSRGVGGITNATSTEVKILTHTPNAILDVPATALTLQFPVGAEVELKVNGVTVDS